MYVPFVAAVASALILGVWLFVMASRLRSTALWWLFVVLGPWPIISLVATQVFYSFLARLWGGPAAGSAFFAMHALVSGGTVVVTFILHCVVVMKVVATARVARTQAVPTCPRCGYNLTGLEQDRCPECGTSFLCEVRYVTRAV